MGRRESIAGARRPRPARPRGGRARRRARAPRAGMAQHNDLDTGHLVPAQRSLQHLRGVSLRNLAVDAALPLPDVFFTLSALPAASGGGAAAAGDAAGAEDEAPVYQSELAPHTANPTWAPIEWAPQARLPRAREQRACEALLARPCVALRACLLQCAE